MQQKELAQLLDISPAMVSRLAKRRMPTDTIERAARWRKRHLEPGRVKGSRIDTIKATPRTPASAQSPAEVDLTLADVEAMGQLIDAAKLRNDTYAAAVRTFQLRNQLRTSNPCMDPRFSVRVWLALTDYMLHDESEVRDTANMNELLTAGEFGKRVSTENPWSSDSTLWEACDFDNNTLDGWPDGVGDDDGD